MAVAKGFVDNLDTVVSTSILGLARFSNNSLSLLHRQQSGEEASPLNVVVRADYKEYKAAGKVAVICGGGAGHEPAHCGYVGKDMLTAAVSGDIFASPSTDAVLHTIVTVTGDAGCLVIVKNYTGDRLNFGLAVERARSEHGLKVQMLVVADDVALPDLPQPRGIAGVCLVHKMAGYAADTLGKDLSFVNRYASLVAENVKSLGVSLSVCSTPGQAVDPRLNDSDLYELGLGIHGEPGAKSGKMKAVGVGKPASALIHELVDTLLKNGTLISNTELHASKRRFALLVNNLGSVPPLFMHALAETAVCYLQNTYKLLLPSVGGIIMIGAYVTSLDMNGISLSLIPLDISEIFEDALLHPVAVDGWTAAKQYGSGDRSITVSSKLRERYVDSSTVTKDAQLPDVVQARFSTALTFLETQIAPKLDEWDTLLGDGDCGRTVAKGARAIKKDLSHYPADPARLALAIAQSIKTMGGSFGVLLCIFFSAASSAIQMSRGNQGVGDLVQEMCTAFTAGVAAVSKYGGAKRGDCTMVDVLLTSQDALLSKSKDQITASNIWRILAEGAKVGVEVTRSASKAKGGRAMYQTKDLSGIPDPGAFAIFTIFEQLATS